MFNAKKIIVRNKLLFLNFNFCQIIVNILLMIWGILNVIDSALYCLFFVVLFNISLNLYVLNWSFKNKIYEADLLFDYKNTRTVGTFLFFGFLFLVKIVFHYIVVLTIFNLYKYLTEMTSTEFNEHVFIYSACWAILVISFLLLIVGGGLMHATRILSSVDKLYPTEKAKLISQFKLDINDTNFCTSGHDVTGFISSGICCSEKGVMYKDMLLKKEDVINYLKAAEIPFSELDDNHVKVLTMYNY